MQHEVLYFLVELLQSFISQITRQIHNPLHVASLSFNKRKIVWCKSCLSYLLKFLPKVIIWLVSHWRTSEKGSNIIYFSNVMWIILPCLIIIAISFCSKKFSVATFLSALECLQRWLICYPKKHTWFHQKLLFLAQNLTKLPDLVR